MMNPDQLNSAVDFDCPFRVTDDGEITDASVYAPSSYDGELDSDDWEYWSAGYTGQHGYRGPIMHPSEYLGGRMARDLLADPGVYCVIADEHRHGPTVDDCGWDDDSDPDPTPNGWAVVRYRADS